MTSSSYRTYILNQNVLNTVSLILDYVGKPACFLNPRLTLLSYHLLTSPAHRDTIETAIDKGLSLMRASGDDVLIFTADQQLYKIVKDIMFYQPTYFESVIPVLGWMHMLMNFIHAAAVSMADSEMNEILAGTFGSVEKMLSGKKYPQNFRAIRMLVEEMPQCILEGVDSFSHLIIVLDAQATKL